MVTNRDFSKNQSKENLQLSCLFGLEKDKGGQVSFIGKGERGFKAAYIRGLRNLRARGIETPKAGICILESQKDLQASINDLSELNKTLTNLLGEECILIGYSWVPFKNTDNGEKTNQILTPACIESFAYFLAGVDTFLKKFERDCFAKSFCLTIGVGASILSETLKSIKELSTTRIGRKMFDQTFLITPDLTIEDLSFDGKSISISQFSRHVTIFKKNNQESSNSIPSNVTIKNNTTDPLKEIAIVLQQ